MCNNIKRELEACPEIDESIVGCFYRTDEEIEAEEENMDDTPEDKYVGNKNEVTRQCKAWWDMTIDTDWEDITKRFRSEVLAYLKVFEEDTKCQFYNVDPALWIRFHTICRNMACALDCDDWQDFTASANAFEYLWVEFMQPRVGLKEDR